MSRLVGQAYQYLQQSKVPTNKFQTSLMRLKIPSLDATCNRYLAALEPIFEQDPRFQKAKLAMTEFKNGPAQELHSALLQYDKSRRHTSYINEFWFNMYLSSRTPLPLNFNPFLAWKDASNAKLNDQLVRSTNFLVSAIRFKRSLEENVLEPDVYHVRATNAKSNLYKNVTKFAPESVATYVSMAFGSFPLDMSQYKSLFNSTRIPRKSKDELLKSDPKENRHVAVIKNGRIFTFDLIQQDGNLNSPEFIYANLKHIVDSTKEDPKFDSITELSSAERDFWASEREHLINLSEKNRRNISKLDSALFVLCLDDVTFEESQKVEGAHNFLHGANQRGALNRWFDKSFSLIVTKDGHASINFEHSWGDGVAVLRFFNETFDDSEKNPQITGPLEQHSPSMVAVERLDFDVDSRLKAAIRKCRTDHLKVTGNLEIGAVEYAELHRNYFKKNKLSPDSMSQLAFQIAFKKVFGHTPVTYESCSTAAFLGGRTETVRPCTNETNCAADAIISNRSNSKSSTSELKDLLQKCSAKHFQLCKEASMGNGFDRHLFALKQMALARNPNSLPGLFSDPIFEKSQHYVLSTSTLYGHCFSGGGFAPVVEDGFGLGYGYVEEKFGVLVSSYKSRRNNGDFVGALTESLDDIRKIVET